MKAKSAEATIQASFAYFVGRSHCQAPEDHACGCDRSVWWTRKYLHCTLFKCLRLSEHEVLIGVNTAGVGVWDAQIRDGTLDPSAKKRFPPSSLVLTDPVLSPSWAHAFAGSRSATKYTRTHTIIPKAAYAEYVATSSDRVSYIPKPLDLEHAGC